MCRRLADGNCWGRIGRYKAENIVCRFEEDLEGDLEKGKMQFLMKFCQGNVEAFEKNAQMEKL